MGIGSKKQTWGAGKKRVRNGGRKMNGITICVTGAVVLIVTSLVSGSVLYLLQRKKKELKSEQTDL